MLIGYARVSIQDQDAAAQVSALGAAGRARTYQETASGARWTRPELDRLLDQLRAGDVVHVWKLDRRGGSLADLLRVLDRIERGGAGFRSVTEADQRAVPGLGRPLPERRSGRYHWASVSLSFRPSRRPIRT